MECSTVTALKGKLSLSHENFFFRFSFKMKCISTMKLGTRELGGAVCGGYSDLTAAATVLGTATVIGFNGCC